MPSRRNVTTVDTSEATSKVSSVADVLSESVGAQVRLGVVAGLYTARTTVALLKRLGLPVLELDVPPALPAIATQIRTVAQALGHPARGEAMVTAMRAELTALGPVPEGPWPVAVVYHPNGYTGGRGSLIDDLLTRAGLRNLAAAVSALLRGLRTSPEILKKCP